MLDLLQLDRDCEVNQVLRQNWKKRTKIDPLVSHRSEERKTWRRVLGVVFIFQTLIVFVLVNWDSVDKNFLASIPLVVPAVLLSAILLVSGFSKPSETREADNFAESLTKLREFFVVGYTTISRLGETELKARADQCLFELARLVRLQEGKSATKAECTRDVFRRAHATFLEFDLVEETWDRFFEPVVEAGKLDNVSVIPEGMPSDDSGDDLLGMITLT